MIKIKNPWVRQQTARKVIKTDKWPMIIEKEIAQLIQRKLENSSIGATRIKVKEITMNIDIILVLGARVMWLAIHRIFSQWNQKKKMLF